MTDNSNYVLACLEAATHLVQLHLTHQKVNLHFLQTHFSKKHALPITITLPDLLSALPPTHGHLKSIYRSKPIRTASGVAVIAVMCKPHRCPHIALTGNICIYCPGGPDSSFEYSSQSYTGYEPTSMRAIRHRYDAKEQARTRLNQLKSMGHSVDKIEFIVMGGTFMSLSDRYKQNFVKNLFDALTGFNSPSLEVAIQVAAKSKVKCVGLTIETRPDFCSQKHIDKMLSYGCTRIEIGVQSVYEDVAIDTNRGHTIKAVQDTFCVVKDAGYKIVSHLMPNLPNVDLRRDYAQFVEFFENRRFRSDGLKIYPTLVIRGTGLYELWKNGLYKSMDVTTLIDFLAKVLDLIPPFVRVYRIQRDIPMPLVSSGVEKGNLREVVFARMRDLDFKCRDTRTREVGIREIKEKKKVGVVEIIRRDYSASNGWETFLSYEDVENDILIGMLRLRKCSTDTYRKELIYNSDSLKENCVNNMCKNDDGKRLEKSADKQIRFENLEVKNFECKNEQKSIDNDCCKENNEVANKSKTSDKDKVEYTVQFKSNVGRKFITRDQISHKTIIKTEKYRIIEDVRITNDFISIIRELHVYGLAVPVCHNDDTKHQHKGYGNLLLDEAERIARYEHKSKKIAIISGVGTREYYAKFGYKLEGPYMVKYLD